MTPDESEEVGKISKSWSGMLKEAFTDADNFGIRLVYHDSYCHCHCYCVIILSKPRTRYFKKIYFNIRNTYNKIDITIKLVNNTQIKKKRYN